MRHTFRQALPSKTNPCCDNGASRDKNGPQSRPGTQPPPPGGGEISSSDCYGQNGCVGKEFSRSLFRQRTICHMSVNGNEAFKPKASLENLQWKPVMSYFRQANIEKVVLQCRKQVGRIAKNEHNRLDITASEETQ